MRNILITGGGMSNKGAQSMTFICVSELRERYPQDRIVLLTLANEDYSMYNFDVQHISYPALKCVIEPISRIQMLVKRIKHKDIQVIKNLYRNARMVIDISGYALGSNWADATVDYYLSCIECARKYAVPVYIMPQSFGPFDYGCDSEMMHRIQSTMVYPRVVYARENEGYNSLADNFQMDNLEKSCDMVLKSKEASLESVYKRTEPRKLPIIFSGAAAVIPNVRNFDHKDINIVLQYYSETIHWLLGHNRVVYLLHHSKEDAQVCIRLKELFSDKDNVIVLREDFDCFEYEMIVTKFDYIIASRYHAIIHALKKGIPCIAIGWAAKYTELLGLVKQDDCVLDVRNNIQTSDIHSILAVMNDSFHNRKTQILECVNELQNLNLFDEIATMEAKMDGEKES